MTSVSRDTLKDFEIRGSKPSQGGPLDLIDSAVNWNDDAATNAETATGTATDKFVTVAGLASAATGLVAAASTTVAGKVELATDAETQTGTDTERAITPANLQACTSTATRKGVKELATDTEVQTGTDTERVVTPAGLQACTSTATRKGVIELATAAEALAGTDAERALTPSTLSSVVGATAGSVTHTYYVDVNRTDTYTPDGCILRPYKTLKAALDLINADAIVHAAAGEYLLTNYAVHVAPGTYSDNLTFGNEKCLRIFAESGVIISGTVTLTQTQASGDYYSRLEFIGANGTRPEKGPALTISGAISGTRNNDSLTYVSYKGCYISGAQVYATNGTWVIHLENCYVTGIISGEMTGAGTPTVLLETTGFTTIKGHIAKANGDATNVCLYTIDNAELDLINITPAYGGRITNTVFGSDVTITAGTYYFDAISYKSMVAQTETLAGATIALLEQTATDAIAGIVELATDAEAQTKSATDRAITPGNLAALSSSATFAGLVELATDAEAKAATDSTRCLTPDNLSQGANAVASATVEAMFALHYQLAPANASATGVHAAITLPDSGTTVVTTAITNPDFPRCVSITGNAVGITGNVVIDGTDAAGATIQDTIALSGSDTVVGAKAFKTVTTITVPVKNAGGDTVTIGTANKFGLPKAAAYAGYLLVYLFDSATDAGGTLTASTTLSLNLYAVAGTPDGSKKIDLVYLV